MQSVEGEKLVTASVVASSLKLPLWAVYRMADDGRIPVVEMPRQPWHKQRQLRFRLSEVKAALEKLSGERTTH